MFDLWASVPSKVPGLLLGLHNHLLRTEEMEGSKGGREGKKEGSKEEGSSRAEGNAIRIISDHEELLVLNLL